MSELSADKSREFLQLFICPGLIYCQLCRPRHKNLIEPEETKSRPIFQFKITVSGRAIKPCLVTFLFWDGKLYCTQSRIEDSSRQEAFNSTSAILKRLSKAGKSASEELNALKRARFEMRKLNFRKGLKEFFQKLGAIRGAAGM